MSAPGTITATGPVTCPSCGHKVAGRWTEGRKTADQRCRSCGCVFEATWPGFTFEPETIIIRQEPGDDAG